MSDKQIITMGYVPMDCSSKRITCGDSDASGTKEITLVIQNSKVSAKKYIKTTSADLLDRLCY